MFTGIIEGRGTVRSVTRAAKGARVVVETPFDLTGDAIGDSIAVDGVCLTAVELQARAFAAEASHETLARTTLGALKPGSAVNLERALRVGDRLGGHMVQGHVDGVGTITRLAPRGDATDIFFRGPAELLDYIVEKGSIAVDGISLTVNGVSADGGFQVTIISHTAKVTTLGLRRAGARVNLETDVVGKYIVSLARRGRLGAAAGALTLEKLEEHGFA